jgi:Flp pilus assembly protein TadG
MFTARARRLGRGTVPVPGMLWRRRRAERGAVAVAVAILLPVLIGIAGLVIDVGSWYETQAQLQSAADAGALAGAQHLPNSPGSATAAAQTLAAKNISGATVTPVTPYNGNSNEIQVTVSKPGTVLFASILGISGPTITASAVGESTQAQGKGGFVYAASSACNAISITNSGKLSSTTLWSNGGITVNGGGVTVTGEVDVGKPLSSCPFPSQLTPPGPTIVGSYTGWPVPLPTLAQGNMSSSCSSASITILDASWLSSNPPGIYCTTGTISITNSSNVTFDGYEFVSESTSSTAINVVTSGNTTLNGYCPSSCSSGGTPQTLFYATAGGISFVNSGSGTFTGDAFAPNGQVNWTVSGGTTTGFVEASSLMFTNSGNATVTGTGPTPSGGSTVKLIP